MNLRSLFRPPLLPHRASFGLLVLRVAAGLAFLQHGWGKIQHPFAWMGEQSTVPGYLQGLAALSEFGGGAAWVLGLLTPLASLGLLCTMAYAVWVHAVQLGNHFVGTQMGELSYEPALVYFCMALMLLCTGPGRYSADQALFGVRADSSA